MFLTLCWLYTCTQRLQHLHWHPLQNPTRTLNNFPTLSIHPSCSTSMKQWCKTYIFRIVMYFTCTMQLLQVKVLISNRLKIPKVKVCSDRCTSGIIPHGSLRGLGRTLRGRGVCCCVVSVSVECEINWQIGHTMLCAFNSFFISFSFYSVIFNMPFINLCVCYVIHVMV